MEELSLKDIATGIRMAIDSKKTIKLPRHYLGMSQLGHSCSRYLWYYFRWAAKIEYSARTGRIFARGDLEEPRVNSYLKDIGINILSNQDTYNDCGGHVSGHSDGLISEVPDIPDPRIKLEIKTMKAKSWKAVDKNGVKIANKGYWVQTQEYMLHSGTRYCLFISVNKDTEELYIELIEFDERAAKLYRERGVDVVWSPLPPKKVNEDPKWYECGWCDFKEQCHHQAPFERTCRTCMHSTPGPEGTWECSKHDKVLSLDEQKAACAQYDVMKI